VCCLLCGVVVVCCLCCWVTPRTLGLAWPAFPAHAADAHSARSEGRPAVMINRFSPSVGAVPSPAARLEPRTCSVSLVRGVGQEEAVGGWSSLAGTAHHHDQDR
jgi:hypothetical protein